MRSAQLLVSVLIGFVLGSVSVPGPRPAPTTVPQTQLATIAPGRAVESAPRARAAIPPFVSAPDVPDVSQLRARVAELERRLANALDAAEPRLASDRLRRRQQLQDSVRALPLRSGSIYFDLADFIAEPSLMGDRPVEFAECLERAVLSMSAHRAPRSEPGSPARIVPLENDDKTTLRYARLDAEPENRRRERVFVRLNLPASLGSTASHLDYSCYARFNDDGSLHDVRLSLDNGPDMSLTRRADGSIGHRTPKQSWNMNRTQRDFERLFIGLEAVMRRLADLDR